MGEPLTPETLEGGWMGHIVATFVAQVIQQKIEVARE